MKKLMCMLVVFAVAAPLYAQQDPNEILVFDLAVTNDTDVTISYEVQHKVTGVPKVIETTPPTAIGLEISNLAGKPVEITAISNITANFLAYPDVAYDNLGGYSIGDGTPLAKSGEPGEAAVPALLPASLSMARLVGEYVGDIGAIPGYNPGPNADTVITLSLKGKGVADIQVDADPSRGGPVGSALDTNLPQVVSVNVCWACQPEQSSGDANGDGWCNVFDLIALAVAYGAGPGNPLYDACADFDQNGWNNVFDLITIATAPYGSSVGVACP